MRTETAITWEAIKQRGEYLGFCDEMGYLYSVTDAKEAHLYSIVAVKENIISEPLITFKGEK